MFPIRLGLASRVNGLSFDELSKVAAAINIQVTRDFGPIWTVKASVEPVRDADRIPTGVWPVFVRESVDGDYAGVHLNDHNQPFSEVLYGPTWSLTASHECLEMLADPSGSRLVPAASVAVVDGEVRDAGGKFEYLVEVCDPCEDAGTAYLVDDVLVSDFYTPHYFDPVAATGVRYSFSGGISRPRQLLPNGYLSWINPVTRTLQQARAFGAPVVVDLGPVGLGAGSVSLRGFVDRLTTAPVRLSNLPAGTEVLVRQAERRTFLSLAADARGAAYRSAARDRVPQAALAAVRPRATPEQALGSPDAIRVLGRPGTLSARPGWLRDGAWIGDRRGIVLTVEPGRADAVRAEVAGEFDGVPVEVREASSLQMLAAREPGRFAVLAEARHELRPPEFPHEVRFDAAGQPVQRPSLAEALASGRPAKPEFAYRPDPAGLPAVEGPIELVLHASPDAGWSKLSAFIGEVRSELVAGLYDFTSAHVLDAVRGRFGTGGRALTLTLDHPARNPTADQSDEETRRGLEQALGPRFDGAWALTRGDPMATAWSFPTAYHIKVAVADREVTWLSSGNWNNSNQPVIDLADPAAARKVAARSDRDWHVIARSEALAAIFARFLERDHADALAHNSAAAASPFAAAAGAVAFDATTVEVPADAFAAGRAVRRFFMPTVVTGSIRVQPLLSPDNYQPQVLALIRRAKLRFYMQTQYIHTPSDDPRDQGHADLIRAVQDLVEANVDVRLITSEFETADWLERLKDFGLDLRCIRIQPKVHNKGVVVDSEAVMVSSQNWSADGTLRNRDAGLIIEDREAAAYFEAIFLHDWDQLAAARLLP